MPPPAPPMDMHACVEHHFHEARLSLTFCRQIYDYYQPEFVRDWLAVNPALPFEAWNNPVLFGAESFEGQDGDNIFGICYLDSRIMYFEHESTFFDQDGMFVEADMYAECERLESHTLSPEGERIAWFGGCFCDVRPPSAPPLPPQTPPDVPPPVRLHRALTDLLTQADAQGRARVPDPGAVAVAFMGSVNVRVFLGGHLGVCLLDDDDDAYMRRVVNGLWAGMAPVGEGA